MINLFEWCQLLVIYRDNNRQLETVLGRYGSAPEPEPEPELEPQLESEVMKSVADEEEEEQQVEKEATEDDEFNIETEEKDLDASRQPSSTKDRNFDKVCTQFLDVSNALTVICNVFCCSTTTRKVKI